jgi:hypothetical protein
MLRGFEDHFVASSRSFFLMRCCKERCSEFLVCRSGRPGGKSVEQFVDVGKTSFCSCCCRSSWSDVLSSRFSVKRRGKCLPFFFKKKMFFFFFCRFGNRLLSDFEWEELLSELIKMGNVRDC